MAGVRASRSWSLCASADFQLTLPEHLEVAELDLITTLGLPFPVIDMDDQYAINVGKTEFREAFNAADPDRMIALLDPGFVDFSEGRTCAFGQGAADELKEHLAALFRNYTVHLAPIIIEIRQVGDLAYDYGWHNFTLTPKQGGTVIERHERYVDIWKKNAEGQWKLWMYMDNRDVPQQMVAASED